MVLHKGTVTFFYSKATGNHNYNYFYGVMKPAITDYSATGGIYALTDDTDFNIYNLSQLLTKI